MTHYPPSMMHYIGKSTTINALRGIADDDLANAARVNEVETTMAPTQYQHPTIPKLCLWDIPGAGTMQHPIQTYFDDKGLLAFDCLVLTCE